MDNFTYRMQPPIRSVLPSYDETPSQMSPFGNERWDIDEQENQRRKAIHREYVYNFRKPVYPQPLKEYTIIQEETPPVVVHSLETQEAQTPANNSQVFTPQPESHSNQSDYFQSPIVVKTKSLAEISFDTPSPPNLYPVLKFPEKRVNPTSVYTISNGPNFVSPVNISSSEVPELPPKPQFSEFKDVTFEKPKVVHYGVHVPFWPFPDKNKIQ